MPNPPFRPPLPHFYYIPMLPLFADVCDYAWAWLPRISDNGGASSAVRAQCNYLGVWPY